MMKRIVLPTCIVMLILGIGSLAEAIDDGTYDFYGTFSAEAYFADGVGGDCALALNNMTCPSTANFCIKNLDASSNVITSNDPGPHYGIGMGILDGIFDTDFDGTGPVSLTVGGSGADDTVSFIDVGSTGGSCVGPVACVDSASKGMEAPGGDAATVTGEIPFWDDQLPSTFPQCAGGDGSYDPQLVTSETARAKVTNENGPDQTFTATGAGLSGSDPTYSLKLVSPTSAMRTLVGTIEAGIDVVGMRTFEGTLCRRTGGETCIPVEFTCPAEDD
jgi:hypothetical protein